MEVTVERIVSALLAAERQVALLQHTRPLGLRAETERLVAEWESGSEPFPRLAYARPPELTELRRGLDALARIAGEVSEDGPWFAERARELSMDAQLVQSVGSDDFASLATLRFPSPRGALGPEVTELCRHWLTLEPEALSVRTFRSDDEGEPRSLWSVMRQTLSASNLEATLELDAELPSVAAAGIGVLRLRPRTWLTESEARRIAAHEIRAHLAPRASGARLGGVLHCGAANADTAEEGRAILIEAREGLLSVGRRRALALRHLACELGRGGASFVEVMRELRKTGADCGTSVETALRAFRGAGVQGGAAQSGRPLGASGMGLGRELVYLPAYLHLRKAFGKRPGLESWFARGRSSLAYAEKRFEQQSGPVDFI